MTGNGTIVPCDACGQDWCPYASDDEPCWGAIEPIDRKQWQGEGYNDEFYLHACQGHKREGQYTPPPE